MVIENIHTWLVLRLVLAWITLSLVIGGLVYRFGNARMDSEVMVMAKAEAANYTAAWKSYGESPTGDTLAVLNRWVESEIEKGDMIVVEIYDTDLNQVTNAVKSTAREIERRLPEHSHEFAKQSDTNCEEASLDGERYLRVFVPIRTSAGVTTGYLEGIYHVPAKITALIQQVTTWSLVLVVLVIFTAVLVLYPMIIRLHRKLLEQSHSLMLTNIGMLKVLGSAIAKRDSDTNVHNYRVTLYSVHIGERLKLPAAAMRGLIKGAFLHDLGKLAISDSILHKSALLTEVEFEVMKTHVKHGEDIIKNYEWLQDAISVTRCHHEKFDGSGYPDGLRRAAIPLQARIFAVADVFDALTSRRPYKEPYPLAVAAGILSESAGSHFDPDVVRLFLEDLDVLYAHICNESEVMLHGMLERCIRNYFR